MPFHRLSHPDETTQVGLWKIEESLSFFTFLDTIPSPININHESGLLQYYSSRLLAQKLSGHSTLQIEKDEFGKPFLIGSNSFISLSHTAFYSAVVIGKNQVAIDVETINPKVERIAHKFLQEEEIEQIKESEKLEKLILYWSAKEALYKYFGRKGLEFKTQLLIEEFELKQQGTLSGKIIREEEIELTIHYRFFDNHVLTFITD